MNALFQGAMDMKQIDKEKAVREINSLIKWQTARKRWHSDKTRQKMASGDHRDSPAMDMNGFSNAFKPGDFGLNAMDLQDMELGEDDDDSESEEDEDEDPIAAERKRRQKRQDMLKRNAGEPEKPEIEEIYKMMPEFLILLRMVLAGD